jgi:hypothetical protein
MRNGTKMVMTALFSALFVIVFAAAVHAGDITVHVPVELNNMPPDIIKGIVQCDAFVANAGGQISLQQPIGSANAPFDIVGNNYSSTLNLIIKNAGKNPPAIGCRCVLRLIDRMGNTLFPDQALSHYNYRVDGSKPARTSSTIVIQ